MIYPALTYLAEIDFANVTQDGSRKLYSLTNQGREYLTNNQEDVETILRALSRIGQRMDDVREAFAGIGDIDGNPSDTMHRASRALKLALRRKWHSAPSEQLRISEILEQAVRDILGR